MSILGKTIHDNSGGLGQASRTKLESTVLEHEFGHILGLVDLGSPMQTNHKDAAHGNHCNNTNCLMYYASETTDILGILITGNIPPLVCIGDPRSTKPSIWPNSCSRTVLSNFVRLAWPSPPELS